MRISLLLKAAVLPVIAVYCLGGHPPSQAQTNWQQVVTATEQRHDDAIASLKDSAINETRSLQTLQATVTAQGEEIVRLDTKFMMAGIFIGFLQSAGILVVFVPRRKGSSNG